MGHWPSAQYRNDLGNSGCVALEDAGVLNLGIAVELPAHTVCFLEAERYPATRTANVRKRRRGRDSTSCGLFLGLLMCASFVCCRIVGVGG